MENRGTSLRRVRYLRGLGAFAAALVLVISQLLVPFDPPPIPALIVVVTLVVVFGLSQIWLARKVSADVLVELPQMYQNVNLLPPAERIRQIRKHLIGVSIVFPLLSFWVIRDLNRLQSGLRDEVRVWWPVGVVYDSLGYWPAVLSMPALGTTILLMWLRKLVEARSEQ